MVIHPDRTMRHITITLLLNLFFLATGQSVALASEPPPLATVAVLDVPRYMGRWYEIAKYPNRFQRKCVADTSAEYKLEPDGRVQVINRCRMENGEWNEAVGMARQVGDTSSPKLEVRFAPAWLSFITAVWGDYWVIDLDPEYQLVAVSEPRREYLWVLSRSPVVSQDALAALLDRLRRLGFDTNRLQLTLHGKEQGGSR
jgi:apolipoprotein D and lipocalin family protein